MQPTPDLDRRAVGLLSSGEEARLRAQALSDPALRRALEADDVVERAFAADRAARMPPAREPDPALLERLVATRTAVPASSLASGSSALRIVMRVTGGLGLVAAGFFGVRALIHDEPMAERENATQGSVVRAIDVGMLRTVAADLARTLPPLATPSPRVAASVDSGRHRSAAVRAAGDGRVEPPAGQTPPPGRKGALQKDRTVVVHDGTARP